ncbi:MAG: DNA repair protein RadC [Oxalobacter sp.]|nr:DNA repair protein RadC [Oxalobacter sp.]
MAITDWPTDERPREKLMERGPGALTDAELLAIFLRTGVKGKSAVELGREIMAHFGSFSALLNATKEDLKTIKGIGIAKMTLLTAIVEIARRLLTEELNQKETVLTSSDSVKRYLQLHYHNRKHEAFVILFLDVKNRLIEVKEMFKGTLTRTSVYPREVVKEALNLNAANVILSHNHPSGVPEPSRADIDLTQLLKDALKLVDVTVLDHIVVAGNSTCSFAEQGLL